MSLSSEHRVHEAAAWRVDNTPILVLRRHGLWRVTVTAAASHPIHAVLKKHCLIGKDYRTRAEAVDAVRMMLISDPVPIIKAPVTRWVKQDPSTLDGVVATVYTDRAGTCQLLRTTTGDYLRPLTGLHTGQAIRLECNTLRKAALAADFLNL